MSSLQVSWEAALKLKSNPTEFQKLLENLLKTGKSPFFCE